MTVLNENLTAGDLSPADRRGLGHQLLRRRKLVAGTRLYKFTEFGVFTGRTSVTPWWAFTEPYTDGPLSDPGLDGHLSIAHALGLAPLAYARRAFAVMFDWNSLASASTGLARVQHATLREDVYGFVAAGAAMPAYEAPGRRASQKEQDAAALFAARRTPRQQRESEAMWQAKALRDAGTLRLPGGAVQVCIKNMTSRHLSVGSIQLCA